MAWSRRSCTRSATRWPTAPRCWPSRPRRKERALRVLLYRGDGLIEPWARDFARLLPQAEMVTWQEGEPLPPCDYAVLWAPAPALLEQLASVKAIFPTGAGVDAILKFGDALPEVP